MWVIENQRRKFLLLGVNVGGRISVEFYWFENKIGNNFIILSKTDLTFSLLSYILHSHLSPFLLYLLLCLSLFCSLSLSPSLYFFLSFTQGLKFMFLWQASALPQNFISIPCFAILIVHTHIHSEYSLWGKLSVFKSWFSHYDNCYYPFCDLMSSSCKWSNDSVFLIGMS